MKRKDETIKKIDDKYVVKTPDQKFPKIKITGLTEHIDDLKIFYNLKTQNCCISKDA